MSSLKLQGIKAFSWDFLGKLATHGTSFVVGIFLARMLDPSDFGLVAMVMIVVSMAGIFSDAGLSAALIQRRRVLSIHYSSVFFFNIIMGMALTIVVFVSSPYIAGFYGDERLISLTKAISISFLIAAFSSVQSTKLRKELNYGLLTKIAFSSSLISGIVGVGFAFYGMGVWALVIQSLTQGTLYNIFIWTKSRWNPKMEFSIKALSQLWRFGFHMFLSGVLNTLSSSLDTLIIGKIFPPATLGYFNRAKTLNGMVVAYSSSSLLSVLFPILSRVQNDLLRFQNIIKKTLGIIIFTAFFLLGVMYLVSYELVVILFGEKWIQTVDYFKILVLSGFGYPISALLVNVLSSRGKSKSFLRLEIYKKMLIPFNMLVLYFYGVEAFLYFLILTSCIAVYMNIAFASREIEVSKKEMIKPILVEAAITVSSVVVVAVATRDLSLSLYWLFLLKGSLFFLIYVGLNATASTSPFTYFMGEFRPVFKKVKRSKIFKVKK